jgi:DNA-binding MarR family transcriptional regulator
MENRHVMGGQSGTLLSGGVLQDPCIIFRRASRAVSHLYDLVLTPVGLKATQVILLQAIGQAGEMTQSQLADEYGISPENLSRRLANLRRAGLIEPQSKPCPGRARPYRLTAAGSKKLEIALPYWTRAQERLCAIMGRATWQSALAAADQVGAAARIAEDAKFANKAAGTEPLPLRKQAAANSASNLPHCRIF